MLLDFASCIEWLGGQLELCLATGREMLAWDGGRISRRHAFGASISGVCAVELGELDEAAGLSAAAGATLPRQGLVVAQRDE